MRSGTIIIIGPGLDSTFFEDHLGLESDELVGLDRGDEDLPQALRSPSPGGMEAGDMIPDGLSDPDESSDEVEITNDFELQRFASALQDAQQRAIQLEKEQAKQKKKTPKTYLGNSAKTLARREKARQVLASQGFHDVFSFMAMKERDKEAMRGCVELDDPSSAVGSLAESSPVGMLVDSPVGSLSESSPVGMLVDSRGGSLSESSPIGTLVISRGGSLSESTPIGALADSQVGALSKSSPVGTLLDSPRGGSSSPVVGALVDLRGGPLSESSPVGALVNTPRGGSLSQSLPVGTLVDLRGDLLSEPSPVGALVNSPRGGLLSQSSPVGALVDLRVGALVESSGVGSLSESLGVGTLVESRDGALVESRDGALVESRDGALAKLRTGRHRAGPSPSHAYRGRPGQDEDDVIAAGATDESCPQATQFGGLLDQSQPEPSDDRLETLTLAEEEESAGEETPSSLWRAGIGRRVEVVSRGAGSGGDGDGSTRFSRGKGKAVAKEPHWAAEEEEESSDESLKLIDGGVLGDSELEADDFSDFPAEGLGHTPAPVLSRTPTVFSRLPSEESDNVLEPMPDKMLEPWKDREALSKARVTLVTKSRDSRLDVTLRARLTGMIGVLNLYLDPKLNHTWTKASVTVANITGHGVKRARKLREWILAFVQSEVLPVHHYSQPRWNVLDDEDIAELLQSLLLSHTKGRYITASDVVEIISGPVLQEKFLSSGISRASISERTACRWLKRLSWRYGAMQNGMYLDGHEREDVVAYRVGFVARWKEYEKRFHIWDNDGVEHRACNDTGIQVEGGRYRLILVTHDESVFYQNDSRKTHWVASTSKPTPLPKGDGQSIMVSDFLTSEWGRLCDHDEQLDLFESVSHSLMVAYLSY